MMKRISQALGGAIILVALAALVVIHAPAQIGPGTAYTTVPASYPGSPLFPVLYNVVSSTFSSHASVSSTALLTVPGTGTYRITAMEDLTAIGASCGAVSTDTVSYIFQDPNATAAQTVTGPEFQTDSGNSDDGTLGQVGLASGSAATSLVFRALSGSAVKISTTYSAGASCSPGPTVQRVFILESLGQ